MNTSACCVMMGRFAISDDSKVVMESFVGSGIALCLYDPHAKIACMAHIMHPETQNDADMRENYAKYANVAIRNALTSMAERGAQVERILAKMAGGAEIFSHQEKQGMFNIGERNIQAVKSLLSKKGIKLVSEDTGMSHSRHISFSVESGQVTSMQDNGKRVIL